MLKYNVKISLYAIGLCIIYSCNYELENRLIESNNSLIFNEINRLSEVYKTHEIAYENYMKACFVVRKYKTLMLERIDIVDYEKYEHIRDLLVRIENNNEQLYNFEILKKNRTAYIIALQMQVLNYINRQKYKVFKNACGVNFFKVVTIRNGQFVSCYFSSVDTMSLPEVYIRAKDDEKYSRVLYEKGDAFVQIRRNVDTIMGFWILKKISGKKDTFFFKSNIDEILPK